MKHNHHLQKANKNREELGITEDFTSKHMMLRFIQEDEVTQKNQIFLVFKAQFLAKIKQLEANKHCLQTQRKIFLWIEQNWEDMYEKML